MFSNRLKQLRKERGLTQIQFAQGFNVASGTIAMWETGKREPDFDTVRRIADFFHVSIDYLLGEDKERPAPVDRGGLSENEPAELSELRLIFFKLNSEGRKRLMSHAKYLTTEPDCVAVPPLAVKTG